MSAGLREGVDPDASVVTEENVAIGQRRLAGVRKRLGERAESVVALELMQGLERHGKRADAFAVWGCIGAVNDAEWEACVARIPAGCKDS